MMMMITTATNAIALDFGYPWWLNNGHLAIAAVTAAPLLLGYFRAWPRWLVVLLGAIVVWSGSVALLVRFGAGINACPPLPTEAFLRSGTGRVLDLGAGTGRSSIMVLTARPRVTLVASDLFADSFDHHFGRGGGQSPQQRLLGNLNAAGVAHRASVAQADMRKLPFDNASFDAIVSSYAVDHLNREGIRQALSEAARVVKPGGDFLLMLVSNDRWAKLAFGPLLSHGVTRGRDWWIPRLREAGFQVIEDGTVPVTLYILARK